MRATEYCEPHPASTSKWFWGETALKYEEIIEPLYSCLLCSIAIIVG